MQVRQSKQDLLKKITEEHEFDDFVVTERDGDGSSIMSSLSYVTFRAKGKTDMKLFVKTAAWSEKLRQNSPIIPYPFTIELYFYRTLWKQYEKLEDICNVPKENRFLKPTFYGSSDEYLNETVVIQDLIAHGYEEYERNTPADFEYMSAGIALIAQFHALSLAYSQYDPEGFIQANEYLTYDESKLVVWIGSMSPKMLANAFSSAEKYRDKLEKYFKTPEKLVQLIMDCYRRGNDKVLVHGDFKPSNLMHRRRNGKLELCVIDFQNVHDADAVADIMYFIFTATDESFRRAHYHELLDLYYEELKASLLRLRVDPELVYPENIYRSRLEKCAMLGLAIGVACLPTVLVDKENAPDLDKDPNSVAVEGSALFKERFNGILNSYVEWGLL